ncbi:MAG TPA: hypothetical protein VII08_24695, partial [Myxococcales bacterium]
MVVVVDVVVCVDGDGDGDVAVDDRACRVCLALTAQAAEQIPRGNATLLDQLRRAASSISLH